MELSQLREAYQIATREEDKAQTLWKQLAKYKGDDALTLAYKGAVRGMLARFGWNPLEKLTMIKESMRYFRRAVRRAPQNPEIRFLRFSIQHSLPVYLNMHEELPEDKALLMQQLPAYQSFQLNPDHLHTFIRFFQESGRFDEQELASITALIPR